MLTKQLLLFLLHEALNDASALEIRWTEGYLMSQEPTEIVVYIITQVILAFWLVLAYDLLEDKRIDDDTARFKFFWIFWILNLSQSQFFARHSNQYVRFILYGH